MQTLPPLLNPVDMSATQPGLPPLGKPPAALSQTMKAAAPKTKIPSVQPITPVELRAKAEKELLEQSESKNKIKEKGKLKPLKPKKKTNTSASKDRVYHIEILRLLEERRGDEQESYSYCKKAGNFYEFYMCEFKDIRTDMDDYITISSRGVTHFVNKEAEFLTLSEWRDEVENYQKINQISFFKNFRIGKSFALWKRLVKRTKMIERGSYLTKELFQADGQINKQLISIRQALNKLISCDILQVFFIMIIHFMYS